ncbi:MAG: hypothetical protein JWM80_2416 [Cyanobacteria bacterium RYN_339]|nr:hypothetical protein [Cyanobacteria bacterium RYN_339]
MRRFAATAIAAALCLVPTSALACGGLFCRTAPIVQNGEKILFATDSQNVIAYVQIQYQGDANEFSWVVPVPTEPALSVGTDAVFTALSRDTVPTFNIDIKDEGTCKSSVSFASGAVRKAAPTANAGAVQVVSQNQVGPYDSAVIKSDDPGALKQWLKDNGYVLPPKLDPLLDPYVAGKYYFVALKLTKDRAVGDIQPIVLKYASTKPGIPIRLTGVAANPDMDVYVWVLGKKRAIPENYRHAIINEARIDWLTQGSNYNQVVTEAMNEAGGQAFVTDYAGGSQVVDVGSSGSDLEKQVAAVDATDPVAFYNQVLRLFAGTTKGQSFVKKYIPKPSSVTASDQDFYNNLNAYQKELAANQTTVDVAAARTQLTEELVKPQMEAEKLFKGLPYLTRMYTTMSPEEMTQDPMFVFNGDLPLVSKDHTATGVRKCSGNVEQGDAPILITLENGLTYTYDPRPTSGAGGTGKLPAAAKVEQLKSSGAASLIKDNSGDIQKVLATVALGRSSSGQVISVPKAGLNGFGCAGCGNTTGPAIPVQRGADEGLAYALVFMGFVGYRRWVGRRKK